MAEVATFCGTCGDAAESDASYCRKCGAPMSSAPAAPYAPFGPPPGGPVVYARPPSTNGMAIASLVFGILPIAGIGAILAIVFGHVGKKQIDESNGQQQGRGLALAGIVLGWVWIGLFTLLFVAIIVIGGASNVSTSHADACNTEKSVIVTAQEAYKAQNGFYPASMDDLTTGEGALLASTPDNYSIDGLGGTNAIPDNPGGCT